MSKEKEKVEKPIEKEVEVVEEKPSARKAELKAIFEAYKISNPIKAAQKAAEFERKLAQIK